MLQNQIEYEKLYQTLRKSEFGMTRPVFEVLVAALIKEGYLVGYKGITQVNLESCHLPLSQAVDTLCTGQLIAEELQEQVQFIARGLFRLPDGDFNIGIQETIWQKLKSFRDKAEKALHHISVEFNTLAEQDTFNPDALVETKKVLASVQAVVQLVDSRLPSKQGLERFVQQIEDPSDLFRMLEAFDRVVDFVKNQKTLYLEIVRYLTHPALVIPEAPKYVDLIDLKQDTLPYMELSDRLILFGGMDQLSKGFLNFRDRYVQTYVAEHKAQQQQIDIKAIEELRQSTDFKLLYRFSQLPNLTVPDNYKKMDQLMDKLLESHCIHLNENELRRYPRCRCDFVPGQSTETISVDTVKKQIGSGVRQYLKMIQTDPVIQPQIEKYVNAMVNLERDFPAGKLSHLLHLDSGLPAEELSNQLDAVLENEVIGEIKQALKTSVRFVTRDMAGLIEMLQDKHYSVQGIQQAFQDWLDKGEEPVRSDSYIKVVNSQRK